MISGAKGEIMQGVLQFNFFGMMKREGGWYIAHCPPLDITTQGRTQAEARRNLIEASQLFVISCLERGTLDEALRELGFTEVQKVIARRPDNAFSMVVPVPLRFQKNSPCHA
jgi:predicted RNase H-like HicB family nuclease